MFVRPLPTAANCSASLFCIKRYVEIILVDKIDIIKFPDKNNPFVLVILLRINPVINPITNDIMEMNT